MPGNYLLDPRDLGKPHARAKRAAVKTLILTNKDRASSGLKGKICSLIPLSSILHGFHWALTGRVFYKDSIETSSILWRELLKFDKATMMLSGADKTVILTTNLAGRKFPIRLLLQKLRLKEKSP